MAALLDLCLRVLRLMAHFWLEARFFYCSFVASTKFARAAAPSLGAGAAQRPAPPQRR